MDREGQGALVIRAAILAIGLCACTDSATAVAPAIDIPINDSASAFPLESITLSVAHEGAADDLTSAKFVSGAAVELAGVPFGDDLVIHMTGRVGTSEVAYGRTCSFSVGQRSPPPIPHLLFSRSVRFAQLATEPELQPLLRKNGVAITYHDGSGLLLGGVDPSDPTSAIADIERFDPRTGELRLLATVQNRLGAVAAPLGIAADAHVALIGGIDPSTGSGATFVELIEAENPADRRVERIDDAQMDRIGLTATALTDGRVIAIGGMRPPSDPPSNAVDEVSLSNGTAVVRTLRAQLVRPRTGHTATRLGDDVGAAVLVAGGLDAAKVPVGAAELFKPLSEDFSKAFTATMVVPRSQHEAVRMPDGSVLILGGVDAAGAPVLTLELFTLDAGFVKLVQRLPINAGVLELSATTLRDGRVLLTGGRLSPGGPAVDTAFIANLDPIDGSVNVVATDHLSVPRAGHQATLLCDGTVLITGGTSAPSPAERYNPPGSDRSFGRR